MPLSDSKSAFDPRTRQLFEGACKDAIYLAHAEVPQAKDMLFVRKTIEDRIVETIGLGERDQHRLAKDAVSHLRQAMQLKESRNRVTRAGYGSGLQDTPK